jgi:hypothetical protein
MKKLLLLSIVLISVLCASAQYSPSPFKHLLRCDHLYKVSLNATAAPITQNAFRFSAVTGYEFPTNQIVAGLAYGFQHLTADTAGNWFENYGIGIVAFGGGSTTGTFTPANVFSAGLNFNIENGLLSLSPVYNFGLKQFGVVWSLNLPLK